MENAVVRASHMPIWVGVIVGALIGLTSAMSFLAGVTLGFVLGYMLYARNLAVAENGQWQRRYGALLERVSLLEYSVKRLQSDPQTVAELKPRESTEGPSITPETTPVEASPRTPKPPQYVSI